MLVKDYWSAGSKWITWETTTLARAYAEYPYAGVAGYPLVAELVGQLNVVFYGLVGSGVGGGSLPEGTIWEVVDNGQGEFDMTPRFAVEGHTGAWGVAFYEPASDSALRAMRVEGDDARVDDTPGAHLITSQSLDVYPLEPAYALPDRWWEIRNGALHIKGI